MEARAAEDLNRVHEELVSCARLRARLDADELQAIRRGLELQVWKGAGCASMNEYLRRHLNYGALEARERIRAARLLADVPEVERSLRDGRIGWLHARTLAPIVSQSTAAAWVLAAQQRHASLFREFAKGAASGDLPEDDRRVSLRPTEVVLELLPDQLATVDEATSLMRRSDPDLTREQVVAHGCRLILAQESGAGADGAREPGLSSYQISYSICPRCRQGSRISGGVETEVGHDAVETAQCDATVIGNVDGGLPERAAQDIAPALRRLIVARDRGRCRVPGCRARLFLDVHHVIRRSDGGKHEAKNLALLCWTHHAMVHRGWLVVVGENASDALRFQRADGRCLDDRAMVPSEVARGYEAFARLVANGVSERDATLALEAVRPTIDLPPDVSFDEAVQALLEASFRWLGRTGPPLPT